MLMKRFYLALATVMAVSSLVFTGCSKTNTEQNQSVNEAINGSENFMSSIKSLNITQTKAGELSEEEIYSVIAPMFPVAKDYLKQNGYDYKEDFEEGDPNIIMTALALYDYDISCKTSTKASFTSVLSCIALGGDLGVLAGMGAKAAAKYLAKEVAEAALKRAVPGVGVAIGVVSAVLCLAELE